MPKTYKHLFPQLATFANLHAAWEAARRGKRRRLELPTYFIGTAASRAHTDL